MAFGQERRSGHHSWGVAPGYGEERPSANRQDSTTPAETVDRKAGRKLDAQNPTFSNGQPRPAEFVLVNPPAIIVPNSIGPPRGGGGRKRWIHVCLILYAPNPHFSSHRKMWRAIAVERRFLSGGCWLPLQQWCVSRVGSSRLVSAAFRDVSGSVATVFRPPARTAIRQCSRSHRFSPFFSLFQAVTVR
jgi:hypothetical protein